MIKTLYYQLQLNAEQADFLACSSYGHNRMSYLVSLIKRAALKPYPSLVNGSTETIGIGMVERSIKQLSDDWNLDYKTTKEMLGAMNHLGIITTTSTPQTSTHVLHVVSSWIVDTINIVNPYFKRGFDRNATKNADLDATAIAEEFNIVMNESIASYKAKLPKGGRGKKKTSSDKTVILPTIKGLELYEQMLAKAETSSFKGDTQSNKSEGHPTIKASAEGSVTSDSEQAREEATIDDNTQGYSSAIESNPTVSSPETPESTSDLSAPNVMGANTEMPSSASEEVPNPPVEP